MFDRTATLPLSCLPRGPDLLHGALLRLLVRAPAQKFCPVAKATAGEMIVLELADEFRLEGKPFGIAGIARPAAGTARSLAGKSFAANKRLKNRLQLFALFAGKARAETDVVKLAILVVKTKKQRTD